MKINDKVVIEEGLNPKDQVIIEGILRARPGAKVTPIQAVASTDTTPTPKEEKSSP